ncbi:snRNA-activating protein complex subunit 1 [Oryzias melastigma]|uniref:snRNA-activating protein complex subunit 1 n=1 Tax=Oryzias melastigma TaxID=30732 RepID=UPI000CF7C918|nr:snRNA-activating protein complex subunit 1 [Oryzias melastigma]
MDFCRRHVKADCEELLSRFRRTQSVRFEIFSGIWRDMKFASIFYGTLFHEKRPFARLVLDTAYCYFLPPFSFQIRVGGLYLLYSLYHSQGAVPLEQIRLALKDCEDVKKFEKDAVDAQHFDVVFILHKLMSSKAILFTAMPITLVFTKKRKVETSALCEDFVERAARPQELVNADLLEELSNIHELYEDMKSAVTPQAECSMSLIRKDLASQLRSSVMDFHNWQQTKLSGVDEEEDSAEGTSSQMEELSNIHELYENMKSAVTPRAESSMNLIRKDLASQLRSSVMDFHNWQQTKLSGVDEEEDSAEGTSSQMEASKRAELLASIKSKAFGEAAEMCKSRRHRQVEVDVPVSEAESQHASGSSRIIKPSLRSRTTENILISGELWNEALTGTTAISRNLSTLDSMSEEKPKKLKKFKWR